MSRIQLKKADLSNIPLRKIVEMESQIKEWLASKNLGAKGPVYASVDVRNAGFKIAPVDTNIFPGGFNNLCPSYLRDVSNRLGVFFRSNYPSVQRILIIGESHSRNRFYFSNLRKIEEAVESCGFECRTGTLREDFDGQELLVQTADGDVLKLARIFRDGDIVRISDFVPDLLLLNNDLSTGVPSILEGLTQPLIPSPEVGWHKRKKSDHFVEYHKLILEFSDLLNLDPWFFSAEFGRVDDIDFGENRGMEKVAVEVERILGVTRFKYAEYGVDREPYVFVKNNSGTYGMGVMHVRTGDELLGMSRKMRNKMDVGKNSMKISSLIVQEGLPTVDRFDGLTAEPVLYLVGNEFAGGFFRLNEMEGDLGNLNKKGMKFTKLCFHEMSGYSNAGDEKCDLESMEKMYRILARIASIAAGNEIANAVNKP